MVLSFSLKTRIYESTLLVGIQTRETVAVIPTLESMDYASLGKSASLCHFRNRGDRDVRVNLFPLAPVQLAEEASRHNSIPLTGILHVHESHDNTLLSG